MSTIRIHDPSDERLRPYLAMKDRNLAAVGRRFIAEGKQLVLRLLGTGLQVESVLVDEERVEEVAPFVPEDVRLFIVPRELMAQTTGFAINTGVLAVGVRPAEVDVDRVMAEAEKPWAMWLVVPIVKDQTNLGALIRTAAAMGVAGMLLGPTCCDPFYRRTVRVSMGTVFRLPIVRSDDLHRDLLRLRQRWDIELCATVLDEDAEPLHTAARAAGRRGMALLLGHEYEGLDPRDVAICDRKLTIPMHLGTDSLNISVAAALFCYHFLRPTQPIRLPEANEI